MLVKKICSFGREAKRDARGGKQKKETTGKKRAKTSKDARRMKRRRGQSKSVKKREAAERAKRERAIQGDGAEASSKLKGGPVAEEIDPCKMFRVKTAPSRIGGGGYLLPLSRGMARRRLTRGDPAEQGDDEHDEGDDEECTEKESPKRPATTRSVAFGGKCGGLAGEFRTAIEDAWLPFRDRDDAADGDWDFSADFMRERTSSLESERWVLDAPVPEGTSTFIEGARPAEGTFDLTTRPGASRGTDGGDLGSEPDEAVGDSFEASTGDDDGNSLQCTLRSQRGIRYRRKLQARGDAAVRADRRWNTRVEHCKRSLGSLDALSAFAEMRRGLMTR
jgi:hypothetical protein